MAHLSAREKAQIYSGLEKYARSGMGMEKACQSLLEQRRLSRTERLLYDRMLAGLHRGQSISDALSRAGTFVSPMEREIVTAAESGGKLEKGFSHLAGYFHRLDQTKKAMTRGLVYPLFLLHIAIPITMLTSSVFRGIDFNGEGRTFDLSKTLSESVIVLLGLWLAILIIALLSRFVLRMGSQSAGIDAFLCRLPLLGAARKALAMERYTEVFEIYLLAGRTMSDSFAGAGRASGSGTIRSGVETGKSALAAGESLADVLALAGSTFPKDFVRGITIAEESGQLDRELAEWSHFYAESVVEAMNRLGEWLPKLFYWFTLLVVAALIVRAAIAYRDLISGLLDFSG